MMRLVRLGAAWSFAVICATAWSQTPADEEVARERRMSREERIEAHQRKIDDILKGNTRPTSVTVNHTWADDRTMTREERIKAHQIKIDKIIDQNRGLPAAGDPAWERERTMTREERIKAHQAKIEDIIAANKVVRANAIDQPSGQGIMLPPRVNNPDVFEKSTAKLLKDMNAPEEKIERLRGINKQLWEARVHKDNPTAPEVSAKVQALLTEQTNVLTREESMEYMKRYVEFNKEQMAEAEKARAAQGLPPMEAPQ